MARRAGGALPAMLVLLALILPATLLASQQGAAAAAGVRQQPSHSQVSVAITAMNPQWASPGSTIIISGTVRAASAGPPSHLSVQLLGSSTPLQSVAQLQQSTRETYSLATTTLPGAVWHSSGRLAPGATADWTIRVRASALALTTFGVYPVAAQAQNGVGAVLATTTTFLPYEPAKKGAYAATRPSPAKISWLWPLIDQPLLNEPWQANCAGPQASALAQSLGSGRLNELVRAGLVTQTAESAAATGATSSQAGQHGGTAGQPQILADADNVTWVVDPALLANAQALAGCHATEPRWASAASAWLAELRTATAGRPLTVTPYGDPNVAALIAIGHGADVRRSFQLGRATAGQILHRDTSPAVTGSTQSAITQAAGIGWPTTGVPGYGTLESLANVDAVGTLVVSDAAFPGIQNSVLRTANGGGGYLTALLASQSLTALLATASPGTAFATSQAFLAETALLAQQVPAQPIVVAPPHRFDPPRGLAADLLADTANAPWLSPVSLTSLTSARHIQTVPTAQWPSGSTGQTPLTGRNVLHQLRVLDREINQLESIRARPAQYLYLAVSAVESSAWQGPSKGVATAMLAALADRISYQQQAVRIIAEKRITLGGLKGGVPVSIDNPLGYAVKVGLQLQYSQATGIKITSDPPGLITVAPHTAKTVRLRVQATEVGSTTVTLQLISSSGQLLSFPQRMTIQATQVGVLGMIICAAALGVFLIASAARAVRRGRSAAGDDETGGSGPGDHDGGDTATDRAEPDTVMAERSELGTAGRPGP